MYEQKLLTQHCCEDPKFREFLNYIRYWQPTLCQLNVIQEHKVLSEEQPVPDQAILKALQDFPNATILTISRAACNRVNEVLIANAYRGQPILMHAQCDCESPPLPLYRHMRVMITQNRSKATGVVNGQLAQVYFLQNKTVLLKLPNDQIVNTYPVTCLAEDGKRRIVYPFAPDYALTVHKAQGQTIPFVIIWFDGQKAPDAAAYVALSRVKKLDNLRFLTRITKLHFTPAKCT